jgi:hypothetical protein
MDILTISTIILAVSVLMTGASLTAVRRHKREIFAREEQVDALKREIDRTRDTSTRLLQAHEDVVRDGLTPEVVVETLQKNPTLLTDLIDVDELLYKQGILHKWKTVGTRAVKVPRGGNSYYKYILVTDLCQRCRVEHQYFRDGGHASLHHLEGFYIGGRRLEATQMPTCHLNMLKPKSEV